jgi:hypothetical protein
MCTVVHLTGPVNAKHEGSEIAPQGLRRVVTRGFNLFRAGVEIQTREEDNAMSVKRSVGTASAAEPHIIVPTAVYTSEQVRRLLGLADGTIRREVREGRLRVAERCNRYYFLGAWLLEWIAAGEKSSRRGADRVSPAVSPAVKED